MEYDPHARWIQNGVSICYFLWAWRKPMCFIYQLINVFANIILANCYTMISML
jgi:hypothetical protein